VLSGRDLCDELITRPEESYRLCCVVVCDLETSRIGAPYIYDISNLRVDIGLSFFCITATNHQHFQLKAASITQLLPCHQMDAHLSLSMKVTKTALVTETPDVRIRSVV
jgi:hypothetical protein